MSNDSNSDSDVLDADDTRATWMDIYVLYSAIIGLVAFMTGIADVNAWVSVWGLWTFCSVPYFARERRIWSWKCDVTMVVTALPIVSIATDRVVMRLVAWIQIAVHILLLIERPFQRRMQRAATAHETDSSSSDADCAEM